MLTGPPPKFHGTRDILRMLVAAGSEPSAFGVVASAIRNVRRFAAVICFIRISWRSTSLTSTVHWFALRVRSFQSGCEAIQSSATLQNLTSQAAGLMWSPSMTCARALASAARALAAVVKVSLTMPPAPLPYLIWKMSFVLPSG